MYHSLLLESCLRCDHLTCILCDGLVPSGGSGNETRDRSMHARQHRKVESKVRLASVRLAQARPNNVFILQQNVTI